ncbi:MAG: CBS domain-containing protein [Bacteroidales bacterium]
MISDKLKSIVQEIKKTDKEFKISARELFWFFYFEKRTKGNRFWVNKFLNENQLEVVPDYMSVWIDEKITLRHKKRAKSKRTVEPIQRIQLLDSANKPPITITRDAKLKEAMTLMMMYNFSQLPVMSGTRTVQGVITWETIGYGLTNRCESDSVKDFISNDITILDYETPLLDAISIILKKEFVLVQKSDKSICGIVTLADISAHFLTVSEPFLLLEQIENHIRQILDGKFLVKELKEFCTIGDSEREIEHIDDLNFGDYIRIIENPEHWDRLELNVDRSHFIKQLDKVREIRNDIMHFDPDGISTEQREDLIKMAKFLTELIKYL